MSDVDFHRLALEPGSAGAGTVDELSVFLSEGNVDAFLDALDPDLPGQPGNATRRNNRSGIKIYVQWTATHHRSVLQPPPDQGRAYLDHLRGTYASASSVNNRITHARNLYAVLRRRGHLIPDPFADITALEYRPEEHRDVHTSEEIRLLLAHSDTEGQLIVLLGAHAGLTGPEVAALRWGDIELKGGQLVIRHRTVETSSELLGALRAFARERTGGELFGVQGKVFEVSDDHELRAKLFTLRRTANVERNLGWRGLRNHAGLRLLRLTNDPELVMERLGLGTLKAVMPLVRLHASDNSS